MAFISLTHRYSQHVQGTNQEVGNPWSANRIRFSGVTNPIARKKYKTKDTHAPHINIHFAN